MEMLTNRKRVFWEALLLTAVVFVLGVFLGIAFEGNKLDEINSYYVQSEISLMDAFALDYMIDLDNFNCDILKESNLKFADNIYEEARLLEKYEDSGKITDGLKLAHQKYDILRTFLWISNIKISEKCGRDSIPVVYLYEYNPNDLAKKATQNVWSKILFDLKQEKGDEIVLIPIATNNNLASLDSLLKQFEISSFPVVVIDDEYVVTELSSVEDLLIYLD